MDQTDFAGLIDGDQVVILDRLGLVRVEAGHSTVQMCWTDNGLVIEYTDDVRSGRPPKFLNLDGETCLPVVTSYKESEA